jgi:hypothetical protein
MNPPAEAGAPELTAWVAQVAALQGLELDDDLLAEVVAFVVVARDMAGALLDRDEP